MLSHPEFVLRFGIWIFGLTRGRVRYIGRRSIPREGACLLYSNRIGWLDWSIVTAACERPVRFVFETDRRNGLLTLVLRKWFGAIVLSPECETGSTETAADEIDQALAAGEIVCLFCERATEGLAVCVPLAAQLELILTRTPVPGIPLAIRKLRSGIKVAIGEVQPEIASSEALAMATHELLATS